MLKDQVMGASSMPERMASTRTLNDQETRRILPIWLVGRLPSGARLMMRGRSQVVNFAYDHGEA